jgi:hypothetical protein
MHDVDKVMSAIIARAVNRDSFLIGINVIVFIAAGPGCSMENPPSINYRMNTPRLAPKGFRLPEAEWGKPDDLLVTAWYLTSDNDAYAWYSYIWCERVRVIQADPGGIYHIPNEPIVGNTFLMPLPTRISRQRFPMVYVCNSQGCQGLFHRERERSHLEWFKFTGAPKLLNNGGVLHWQPSKYPDREIPADATLGCLTCFCLGDHHIGEALPLEPSRPFVAISREDAWRVCDFVDRNAETYSDATRLLWRRLAKDYDEPNILSSMGRSDYRDLGMMYEHGNVPDWYDFTRYLGAREQVLVLGSYTKPPHRYDDPRYTRQVAKMLGRVPDE